MNRRSFLTTLAGAGAALAFDPERLLWVKRKTIFIPKPQLLQPNLCYESLSGWVDGTLGFCGDIPIPLKAVDTDAMGPPFVDQGNVYRIVELKPDHHVHWYGSTIFAVPGGKLKVLVRGGLPRMNEWI